MGPPSSWQSIATVVELVTARIPRKFGLDPHMPAPSMHSVEHLPPGVRPWQHVWSAGQGVGLAPVARGDDAVAGVLQLHGDDVDV